MIRVLHFADAHIDMVNHGKHDTAVGLPIRVVDFLKSLDQIVERAIAERVDLVIFAGDAYRHQRPHPRFQQQWQQRIMRLSAAGIPTILLVGNHDTSPAARGAHAMQEFKTLDIANVFVADHPTLFTPQQLGIPVQVIAIPWVSRSRLLARQPELNNEDEVRDSLEDIVSNIITKLIDHADENVPLILTAHATVAGAKYSSERQVMLGRDLVLAHNLVADKRIDFTALGHIHQHQELNKGQHPPVVYSGSIERVDFGEAKEQKGFVLANVSKGKSDWRFVELETRRFIDTKIELDDADTFMQEVMARLPRRERVKNAICRVQLHYSREWESLLDEAAIGRHYSEALSLSIAKHRSAENRSRLGETLAVESLTPEELLSTYWQTAGLSPDEAGELQTLAKDVFGSMLNTA